MKKFQVYLNQAVGAPSDTAVILLNNDSEFGLWKELSSKCYDFFKGIDIKVTKIALLYIKIDGESFYKIIQVRKNYGDMVGYETGYDCGNSMIAAGNVAASIMGYTKLSLLNIDTKMNMSLVFEGKIANLKINSIIGRSFYDFSWFNNSERVNITTPFQSLHVSLVNVANPYIIVNAQDMNIATGHQLVALNNENDVEILTRLKEIRKSVIEKFNLEKDSEFPKIALVHCDKELAARTIYLNKWHQGLPLTAAISISLTSRLKNSVIYSSDTRYDYILTPKGKRIINIGTNIEQREILSCEIKDVKIGDISSPYSLELYSSIQENIFIPEQQVAILTH